MQDDHDLERSTIQLCLDADSRRTGDSGIVSTSQELGINIILDMKGSVPVQLGCKQCEAHHL